MSAGPGDQVNVKGTAGMTLATAASYGSALFAFVAAGLWFWSASVQIPVFTLARYNPETNQRTAPPHEDALRWQSRLSAYAAICAGVAAILQVLGTYLTP